MEMVAVRTAERENRPTKETVLRDFVRFSWKATRGLTTAAEAEAGDLVQKMVAIGRVTPDEGSQLLATLTSRMQGSKAVFEQRVDASVKTAVLKVAEIATKEIGRLTAETKKLEERLAKIQSKKSWGGR